MRLGFAVIATISFLSLLTFVRAAEKEPTEPFSVLIKSRAVTQTAGSGIRFTVEIVNNSDDSFELSVREGMPPYDLFVSNDRGVRFPSIDLGRKGEKNRHQRNIPLEFKSHEKKTYEVTYSRYLDSNGNEKQIRAGVYTVYVIVRFLSYPEEMQRQGYRKAKLLESNRITVTLR